MKKKIKQHFATTYRRLTKKTTAFAYRSTCLVHFTMLAPLCDIKDPAHVLEFLATNKNKNVEIETQDSKQPLIFGNDDDK